eukprot:1281585-Pyramimonas_sp.AAC.1
MNKRKVVEQPKKRQCEGPYMKDTTNKRKIRDQPDANQGERKSKSLFQKHETNKRKERPVCRKDD